MASPYKTWVKPFFPNISPMKYRTDLILGEAFCIFVFFYFPDFKLGIFYGLHF